MNIPKAYATFTKKIGYVFRTSTYIQWGSSSNSLGAILMLNPGAASLINGNGNLDLMEEVTGEIKTDPTMKVLISLMEKFYEDQKEINGKFYIYNLFPLKNTDMEKAVKDCDEILKRGLYDYSIDIDELNGHPWIIIGWGCNHGKKLRVVKDNWLSAINLAGIKVLGIKGKDTYDYYHPLSELYGTDYSNQLIQQYRSMIRKKTTSKLVNKSGLVIFKKFAVEPNIIIKEEESSLESKDALDEWTISKKNPENIVKGFSQLRIKSGYKLKGYQYTSTIGANGVVWAIPEDRELPPPGDCDILDDFSLSPPKPSFSLADTMEAIEGDRSPFSYLQAAIVFHELNEFGAEWHGANWQHHKILPLNRKDFYRAEDNKIEWDMLEPEPEIWEPHFYYSATKEPIVVLHTFNELMKQQINRITHVFSKDNYTLNVKYDVIAEGGLGFIP